METELEKNFLHPLDFEIIPQQESFIDQRFLFQETMMAYNCAIREVRTKLEVLNDDLSLSYKRNPIEFIKSRIKKPASIMTKLQKYGVPCTVESIVEHLNDVAGIRVICSFIDDIYAVADMLTKQDDVTLIQTKDYIKNPKGNGYRSLHLIIEIPVFFADHKQNIRVEIQIRTIAMDFWATLDHQLKYKKDVQNADLVSAELQECADIINQTDLKMLEIKNQIFTDNEKTSSTYDKLEKLQVPQM